MSPSANALFLVPILAVLAALLLFRKRRQKTVDFVHARAAKAHLPGWVRGIELLVAAAFAALLATGTSKTYFRLLGPTYTPEHLNGIPAAYVVLGIGAIILPLAFLSANAVSRMTPILRKANERAFRGNHMSFTTANLGLIKFGAVSIPFGIIALCAAAILPWA